MWWRKSKKVKIVDVGSSVRNLLIDSGIPNIDFFDGALGIHAASDDVIEKEMEESETRLSNIAPIMPIVYAYCAMIKDASTAAIVEEMNVPEEQREAISAVINKFAMGISLGATTGILSQLVDHGLVHLNVRKR
jgi:hypothetical protein